MTAEEILVMFDSSKNKRMDKLSAIEAIQYVLDGRHNESKVITPKQICKVIQDITHADPLARNAIRENAQARHCAMYVLYKDCFYTYRNIGRFFNQNHMTVMNAVIVFHSKIEESPMLKSLYSEVRIKLGIVKNDDESRINVSKRWKGYISPEKRKAANEAMRSLKAKRFMMQNCVILAIKEVFKGDPISTDRKACNVLPRHCAMYFLHVHENRTIKSISEVFNKDLTTVRHGICSFMDILSYDDTIIDNYKKVALMLNVEPIFKSRKSSNSVAI